MTPKQRTRTARHEAAHAVIALLRGVNVHEISLEPDKRRRGNCIIDEDIEPLALLDIALAGCVANLMQHKTFRWSVSALYRHGIDDGSDVQMVIEALAKLNWGSAEDHKLRERVRQIKADLEDNHALLANLASLLEVDYEVPGIVIGHLFRLRQAA